MRVIVAYQTQTLVNEFNLHWIVVFVVRFKRHTSVKKYPNILAFPRSFLLWQIPTTNHQEVILD
jgi:hypothetical protein